MPDIPVTVRKDDAPTALRVQTPYHAVFSAGLATVVFHHAADEERDPARHHRWRRGGSDPHFVLSTERYR
jgi:hypothetical protein